jgi:Concanavalin A-like lectin/glucanases superfamily
MAGSRIFVGSQTGANETYIRTPASAVYNNLNKGTIACWVFATNNSLGFLVIKNPSSSSTPLALTIQNGRALEGQLAINLGGPAEIDSISNELVPLNTWAHVAMTWNVSAGGDGRVHLFLNGTECSYAGFSFGHGAVWDDSTDGYYFGNDTLNHGLSGSLAEVGVWNTVLTGPQIAAAAASTTGVGSIAPSNLVGYWHLCGLASPEPDSSGNGNNGTVNGSPVPATGTASPGYGLCVVPAPPPPEAPPLTINTPMLKGVTTPYKIPLRPSPQILGITLAGVRYLLTVKWNDFNNSWTIDIADVNGNQILSGIPMVTGCDLLAQFKYLNFGGQLIAQTANNTDAIPTFANLGINGNLYFVVKS